MKQFSQACERNQEPIGAYLAEVFERYLPEGTKRVLEVGSGTGQHAVAFGQRFAEHIWQPTNPPGALASVQAWCEEAALPNVNAPLPFDLFDGYAGEGEFDLVMACNVIHIAPWAATKRLFEESRRLLKEKGLVFLYGPFRYEGRGLEPSNEQFDRFLRERDPGSGLRVFEEVDRLAREFGFEHLETRRLPSNNDAQIWRLTGALRFDR